MWACWLLGKANLLALRSCSASSVRLLRHQPASKAFQISEHGHYHHWTAQLISGHAVATCPSPLLNGPLQQCRLNDQPCKETPSLLSNLQCPHLIRNFCTAALCHGTPAILPAEADVTSSPIKPPVWTCTSSFHSASHVSHQQSDVLQPRRAPAESEAAAASDAGTNKGQSPSSNDVADDTKVVLYKGRYMQTFRLLVRFKIFQLVGIAALAIPINTFLMEGSVSGIQMVMASSLILGCGFASTTLWWFSQRYIGELSLMGPHLLRFSVLDFWGNRQVITSDALLEHRHDDRKCQLTAVITV
ncbi:TPA: hypothetical protein ACH3X3_007157 [Trebouxia sp. C0006]